MLHQVGAGTLGPVFRAHDPAEGRLVAIKAFRLDLPPPRAAEFARALDALAARSLDHPSIATPLAAGIEGTTAWFAQAYVPAESLDVALRQYGPPPLADALAIVTQLAGALDFAAAAGVFHGALHPRDILVAPDDTRVVDLGVAAALEQVGLRATMRRPYTAPERIAGGPVTRAADVFALGAIAFELVTGGRVMGAGDEAVSALPGIAGANREALTDTFAFALSAAPDERFTTALGFVAALKRALGDATARHVSAPPLPAPAKESPAVAPPPIPVATPDVVAPAASVPIADAPTAPGLTVEPSPEAPAERHDEPAFRETVAEGAAPARPLPRAARPRPTPHGRDDAAPLMEAPVPAASVPLDEMSLHARPPADTAEWDEPAGHGAPPPFDPALPESASSSRQPAGGMVAIAWKLVAAMFVVGAVLGIGLGWMFFGRTQPQQSDVAQVTDRPAGAAPAAVTATPTPEPATPAHAAESAAAPPAQVSGPREPSSRATTSLERDTRTVPPPPAPKQRPRPVVARGQITVRSRPPGARVEMNGRDRGRTPLTVRDLPLGAVTLRVTEDGYGPEQRRVTLTASRATQTVDVPLSKSAPKPATAASGRSSATRASSEFVGTVFVETRPAGAQVFIDGRLVGTSPVDVPGVSAGSHAVRLDLRGYKRWSAAVTVVAGERHRVAASLEEEEVR